MLSQALYGATSTCMPAFAGDIDVRHSVREHADGADDGSTDVAGDKRQEDRADDDLRIEGQDRRDGFSVFPFMDYDGIFDLRVIAG